MSYILYFSDQIKINTDNKTVLDATRAYLSDVISRVDVESGYINCVNIIDSEGSCEFEGQEISEDGQGVVIEGVLDCFEEKISSGNNVTVELNCALIINSDRTYSVDWWDAFINEHKDEIGKDLVYKAYSYEDDFSNMTFVPYCYDEDHCGVVEYKEGLDDIDQDDIYYCDALEINVEKLPDFDPELADKIYDRLVELADRYELENDIYTPEDGQAELFDSFYISGGFDDIINELEDIAKMARENGCRIFIDSTSFSLVGNDYDIVKIYTVEDEIRVVSCAY